MMTAVWKKSSYSNGEGGNCVEACGGTAEARVRMRDTQNREAGHLTFGRSEWAVLLDTVASTE